MRNALRIDARRAAFTAVAVLVLVAAGARLQASHAGNTQTKYYTTSLSASTAGAGATLSSVTLTLTNSNTPPYVSTQSLGSENVTLPAGFGVSAGTPVAAGGSKTWVSPVQIGMVTLSDGVHKVLQLRAASSQDALAPGESLQVTLTVSVPCGASGSTNWVTEAKQSNDFSGAPGNDFRAANSSNDRTIPFSVSGSCHFSFSTISSPQTAGHQMSFTVSQLDGNNNATHFADTATLTSNFATTKGTPVLSTPLSFGSNATSASGTATTYTAQASAHLSATAGSITNDSNSFAVQPDVADYLAFGPQPTSTIRTTPIPDFDVSVYDRWGNLETRSDQQASISLTIGNDAGSSRPTTLDGTVTKTSSAGIAVFSDVTLDESGIGFTLVASANGLTSDTSAPFDIFDGCGPGVMTCTLTNDDGNTSVTTDFPSPTGDPTLLGMSATGALFDCGSGSSPSLGSIVTIDPPSGYTVDNPISVTLRFDKSVAPGTGVSNFVLCVSKQGGPFTVVGDCPKHIRASDLPCITKRNRNGVGDLILVMLMTSDDPGVGLH